ncbi:acyl-CoA dehydrogenase [Novosphingobium marinum]|uniref:Acyl-[acyl-carrier-protein] dehydrogenase MbtN n=1 Tax=Novosphingobium marinum TaxID=1514948 RepID=A0A7Z0BTD5_9SPHN|nr:acyl-CoA dehydrogenase family protein [Novosphingobium marinum]NYH93978.1 alkylation response protein AidB-like acyl-CoA dehydrogenase [Novosphingobium marinum]GGC18697.1 acyl-CoA dehydrogenase [Novosphingobium marinum]
MKRTLFSSEHEIFRDSVRNFVDTELVPHHAQWEQDKVVPREVWEKAGQAGLLCPDVPEEYGGFGADWLYNVVVIEELAKKGMSGPGFMVHSEMVAPYILAWGSEDLKQKWLPQMVAGKAIGAVAMTEPGAGSDLKELRTRAIRDGDDYVVNGQKTYISNGQTCDFILLACKTDPTAGARGVSIVLTESNRKGFERGRNLEKIGLKAQDTSELFFSDLRVPVANRLGDEGAGFRMLMTKLAQERLVQAVRSICVAEAAIEWTVKYTSERKAFGQTIADFQNTQFVLAQLAAETTAMRVFTDDCMAKHLKGELDGVTAAKVKLCVTDLHNKVVNECLQFFGGYGYMHEYPIARAFIDARITRIAGGAAEVMKQIISRDLFANT